MPKISFVTFCCFDPDVFGGYMGTNAPRDIQIVEYLQKSIIKHYPDSKLVVITNAPEEFYKRVNAVDIIEATINVEHLMYERTKSYVDYIHNHDDFDLVVFIDSDCLLVSQIDDLAGADFDIGLTCHFYSDNQVPTIDELGICTSSNVSPINGGVIFSRPTDAARHLWVRTLEAYSYLAEMGEKFFEGREQIRFKRKDRTFNIKKWGGDQYALMNLFGKHLVPEFPESVTVEGAKILFLDASEYNATPIVEGKKILFNKGVKPRIVHMKGTKIKNLIPHTAAYFDLV